MSEDQKKAVMMRLDGKTYDEIGKEFGVTRQRAFAMVKDALDNDGRLRITGCVYPAIRNKMSERRMSKRMVASQAGVSYASIMNIFSGKTQPTFINAQKIARVLGLTTDEAFARDEGDA